MQITREKRNVAVLAASQALFMTGATMLVILSGLVGLDLAEDKALATLPVSAVMIGNALTMVPASLLMGKIGRRPGFILGALIGAGGAAVAVAAILDRDFRLFVLGTFSIIDSPPPMRPALASRARRSRWSWRAGSLPRWLGPS